MSLNVKKLYMREHSNVVRKWSSRQGVEGMHENPVLPIDGIHRVIMVTICRIRQRVLSQAWQLWVENLTVKHNYESDARTILTRKIPEDELRSELEIEVLYKWVLQAKDIDPTGVANTIFLSKKKSAKYAALQQLRLEFFAPGDTVLFQGDVPRPEDGHFTVIQGECDVLQFPDESVPLMKLQYLAKKKRWDDAQKLLRAAQVVAKIPKYSGFGELSTLTGVRRAASIRASLKQLSAVEVAVLPKMALMDCLKSRSADDASTSEAIDFLRQSGLANRISPKDLVQAARTMIRRTMLQGDILYYRGEPASSMFLVVSGEFLLDIGDFMVEGQPLPFVSNSADKCYYLSVGSILGDEGSVGEDRVFASTAVVVSTAAVVFEATGFGLSFLSEKLKSLRYCALYYKDQLRWDNPSSLVEQVNPYTYFNSLRKTIAFTNPFRGVMSIAEESISHLKERKLVTAAKNAPKSTKKWGQADEEERFLKSRSRKVRNIDSRASFLMSTAAMKSSIEDIGSKAEENEYSKFPRILTAIGLHRAIEINKSAKRSLQNSMKAHAKESILYEQLRKLPDDDTDLQKVIATKQFKKSLKEYYLREEERVRQLREEEERRKLTHSRASSAIKFFANTFDEGDFEPEDKRITIHNISTVVAASASKVEQQVPFQDQASVVDSEMESLGPIQSILENSTGSYNVFGSQQHLTKLQQYYEWMDSLNRTHYRSILAQARQTADILHNQMHHDTSNAAKAVVNDNPLEIIAQLGDVFKAFGLTPQDLNIPWQFHEQSSALQNNVRVESRNSQPSTAPHSPMPSVPVTPDGRKGRRNAVPSLNTVPVKGGARGTVMLLRAKPDASEEMIAKARLDSQFKSYNPASWRDELIMKKAQELTGNVYRFVRSGTPDNRKVLFVRVHDYIIEPYHSDQIKEGGDKLLQATIKFKGASQELDDVNFEEYIDDPEYFMRMVEAQGGGTTQRKLASVNAWRTRYMVRTDANEAASRPPVLDCVRTHLKENLTNYRKDKMIDDMQLLHDQTYSRAMIRTWSEKDQEDIPVGIGYSEKQRLRKASITSIFSVSADTWDRDQALMPTPAEAAAAVAATASQSHASGVEDSLSHLSVADSGYFADITKGMPVLKDEGQSVIRRPSQAVVDHQLLDSGSIAASLTELNLNVSAAALPPTTNSANSSPKRRKASISVPVDAVSVTSRSTDQPLQRITDMKEPSKALRLFEEYRKSQEEDNNAAMEGRKKANKTSKFRLERASPFALEEVSLTEINKKRWKAEWTLFHAMFPNCTQKNQYAFIEAFKRKYPDATIRADIRLAAPESITLNYPSAGADEMSLADSSSFGSFKRQPSVVAQQESQASSSSQVPDDPELLDWQNFTVESIVQTKNGERKTLPEISVKNLNIQGKKYRTSTGKSYVPLVTLAAKKDEEPIMGPTSYLKLYKDGFQVHLTVAEKQHALEELKQYRNLK